MFVGTSTGGLLAVGFGAGIEAYRLADIYENKGEKIFKGGNDSKYDSEGLKEVLMEELTRLEEMRSDDEKKKSPKKVTEYTLADLKVKVGVETALLLHEKGDSIGIMLNNFTSDSETAGISLIEACLATSAAPTYFPKAEFKLFGYMNTFVDGGVIMNNPVLLGKSYAGEFVENPNTELFMTSISTGLDVETEFRTKETQEDKWLSVENQTGSFLYNVVNGANLCMNSNSR
eukprot:CAMPEP_0202958916 /NCGR_PEP_ID=MMETSP1396-20130829/3186_1 /ASSEMBLY_ACC=CAM_ASM_000872 /TAXON_ID= /ORGANISM="Pseudokeronopsis sp., Strain Brazil" /LENGTH=230 /DNA_ID=CAMNT_0049677227 /DNA_START=20 /DNA_END=712 /DNA_ORIENTATION=-